MDVPKLCEFTLVSMGHMSAMDGFLLRVLHGSEALDLDAVKYRFLDLRMQYYVWNKAVREGDWKESSTGVKMVLVRV